MQNADLFQRWKSLAGDNSPTPWDEDYVAPLFHYFRPHGDGLEEVFDGIEGGDELLARLKEVYDCTAEGMHKDDSTDAYFIVREPTESSELVRFMRDHFDKMAVIAMECDNAHLVEVLSDINQVEVIRGARPWPPPDDSPETMLYEVVGDWFGSLQPRKSQALLLKEAYYMIACDYDLASYLMWPLFENSTSISDPFRPYFNLWKHGASFRLGEGNVATVYVDQDDLEGVKT